MSEQDEPPTGRDAGPSGVDPARDPVRWERSVEAILSSAEPELRRRAGRGATVGSQLERWARPVVAAAAALVVGGAALLAVAGRSGDGRSAALTVAGPEAPSATLVSPVVDPWLERDSLTAEAVEEIVSLSPRAREAVR